MKRLKTSTKVIIFGSAFLILLTVFFSFLNYNMHTYLDSGEEYKQNWYCKEYNFHFQVTAKIFLKLEEINVKMQLLTIIR